MAQKSKIDTYAELYLEYIAGKDFPTIAAF